ncbi:MAG: peptide deformylase [Deltaproteobacteria bacterium]|nr:peptide deformylase [Deltaproteobacteria bacterium]MBW2069687.1 peptide deformylase [Deltaproteobacteria bacterium]
MAILEIRKYPEKVLLEKAHPVEQVDRSIYKLADDMAETMYEAPGIGLAANQVGETSRVIVVDLAPKKPESNLIVLVNPEIVAAEGLISTEEGCLSVPDYQADVKRFQKVVVRALNLEGRPVEIEAEDLFAVVLQHEIDHLNGTLFIDRISRLKRDLYKRRMRKKLAK